MIGALTCDICHGTGRLQPFAMIRILSVRKQLLVEITESEVQAEGYRSIGEYWNAFNRINKLNFALPILTNMEVTVVEFELAK